MRTYRPVGLLYFLSAGVCNLLTRPDTIPPLSRIPRPSKPLPTIESLALVSRTWFLRPIPVAARLC